MKLKAPAFAPIEELLQCALIRGARGAKVRTLAIKNMRRRLAPWPSGTLKLETIAVKNRYSTGGNPKTILNFSIVVIHSCSILTSVWEVEDDADAK